MASRAPLHRRAPDSNTKAQRRLDSSTRTPNAHKSCKRCRQHKIKCTGTRPCAHCQRRNASCIFDERSRKVLVTQGWLSDLQSQVAEASAAECTLSQRPQTAATHHTESPELLERAEEERIAYNSDPISDAHSAPGSDGLEAASEQEGQPLANPLVLGPPVYYSPVSHSRSYWMGTSSTWSFGIRVLKLAHAKVFGAAPLPHSILHFDSSTYDLGWDGRRRSNSSDMEPALPTKDFAGYLINAAKFHCGQLFHLFDETDFITRLDDFHANSIDSVDEHDLWFVHYLTVLAIGTALLGQPEGKRPPGVDLFTYALRILPDMIYLMTRPLESVEILCCAAIYLHCIDMRMVAFNLIGQAVRIATSNGWHLDVTTDHLSEVALERCRKAWWTTYTLDCHMSALQGVSTSIPSPSIGAQLPKFGGREQQSLAFEIHVRLAKTLVQIQQTIYIHHHPPGDEFLQSIKVVLKSLASINDSCATRFPLRLGEPKIGISRVSAQLHLFHHQAILLSVKPLLFFFFNKRLDVQKTLRIPSVGGVRALARVSVSSALQTMKILTCLKRHNLLEIFLPFDLESLWSAILVLLIARVIDPSIIEAQEFDLETAYTMLSDMAKRGSLVAASRRVELEHLDMTFQQLNVTNFQEPVLGRMIDASGPQLDTWGDITNMASTGSASTAWDDWGIGNIPNGEQLEAVADSLDFASLDWFGIVSQEHEMT